MKTNIEVTEKILSQKERKEVMEFDSIKERFGNNGLDIEIIEIEKQKLIKINAIIKNCEKLDEEIKALSLKLDKKLKNKETDIKNSVINVANFFMDYTFEIREIFNKDFYKLYEKDKNKKEEVLKHKHIIALYMINDFITQYQQLYMDAVLRLFKIIEYNENIDINIKEIIEQILYNITENSFNFTQVYNLINSVFSIGYLEVLEDNQIKIYNA